jgi:hypothetical protein
MTDAEIQIKNFLREPIESRHAKAQIALHNITMLADTFGAETNVQRLQELIKIIRETASVMI